MALLRRAGGIPFGDHDNSRKDHAHKPHSNEVGDIPAKECMAFHENPALK